MNINRHGIPILPHRHRVKVRQCFKRRHETRDGAFDQLVSFELATGDLTLRVYKCPWCKGFHIGHAGEEQP